MSGIRTAFFSLSLSQGGSSAWLACRVVVAFCLLTRRAARPGTPPAAAGRGSEGHTQARSFTQGHLRGTAPAARPSFLRQPRRIACLAHIRHRALPCRAVVATGVWPRSHPRRHRNEARRGDHVSIWPPDSSPPRVTTLTRSWPWVARQARRREAEVLGVAAATQPGI